MTQTLILPHIERLSPYPMGERPPEGIRTIKLNQNESPYPPSPLVLKALRSIGEEELSRYPDAVNGGLRAVLAERFGVNAERIFCGNGSSEIISLIMKVFVGAQRRVALPDPTFALYATAAAVHQAECIAVPTDSDYAISIDGLLNSGADAVVLVNPNAPTGRTLPPAEVERLVSRFPGLVIIDEAYIDFAPEGTSALPLLGRYENVLLLRTFSKCYALAGARVGYCFGAEPLIAALEKSKDSFNVNAVSAKLAAAALQDREYAKRTAAAVCRTRDWFASGLQALGFRVVPSHTNFVLAEPPSGPGAPTARELYGKLLERGIYVRYFDHPRLADKLRISIGTDEELAVCMAALSELVG